MNRRGLLKTILGAVGLGAVIKALPEPELDPVGLMDDFLGYLDRTGQDAPLLHEGTPIENFTDFTAAPGPTYFVWSATDGIVQEDGTVHWYRGEK